ncbi:Protein of unknown function (DUF4245) [Goodfellowiella coeruleoviolacea]|uniref:DUF4245 domain-containing protein n=2 Tax=Goodfellowiella coeruleoviolacea TaxID=334858 RepID=A0AAE3GE78_9PSEU|nr:Protein of unknown function (DUF4245) [Goodfellowiella coeruleoviolacea]
MVLSLVVLGVLVVVLGGISRGCSFSPGGPSVDSAAGPTVDQDVALHRAAGLVDFPVREPQLPAGWRANSSDTVTTAAGATSVQVGWLTAQGRYLRLAQSSAEVVDLVRLEADLAADAQPSAGPTMEVDGQVWTEYPGRQDERSWVTDLAGVRLLITGNGDQDEVRTVAAAVQRAPTLPSISG